MKPCTLLQTALVVSASAGTATGQTLARLAEQEEARRKAIDNPARVYTNADLRGGAPPVVPGPASEAPPVSMPDGPASQAEKSVASAPGSPAPQMVREEDAADRAPRDEAWWRARMVKLQQDIDRSRTYIDALQSRINALTTDFVNRDDPYQRAVIEADRLKAIAEFERLKKELEQQNKAVIDLQEEARRAAVPPGWLR
jgi:hypothetical protein